MKNNQKMTIYDIAQKAGASPSTVSSALSGQWKRRRIKEETVNRIKAIAAEQGFSINLQARGLRKAKSGLVGMILPEHDNRFFSSLSQAFAAETRKRGFCPAVVSTRRNADEEAKSVESLIAYAIDSLVIVGASEPESLSQICKEAGLPHVFVDQPCKNAPSVVSDNFFGAKLLAEQLLETMVFDVNSKRDQRLFFLGGEASLYASSQRIAGFIAALKANRLDVNDDQIIACGYEREVAKQEITKLYQTLGRLPSGLLINSILTLEGVMNFLATLPEEELRQCTLGCYDFDPFVELLRFPVFMIRQRANALIECAYKCIDDKDTDAKIMLIEPVLVTPSFVFQSEYSE